MSWHKGRRASRSVHQFCASQPWQLTGGTRPACLVNQALLGILNIEENKGNTVALEAMKVMTDAVQPVTAVIPSVTPPIVYDFAGQLLASQRKLAEDMLHLTVRLTPAPAKPVSAPNK